MTPGEFAPALLAYCQATNGSVTSYIRSFEHNARVGGVHLSFHLVGLAADVIYDEPIVYEEAERIAHSFGLHAIREGDHDHVQPLHGGPAP